MIRPFVKWAGGKSRVLPDLLPHLPKAHCLVEPFVGGASVFLNTDYRRYVLGDINADLIALYRHVKNDTEAVITMARHFFETGNSLEAYATYRDIFNLTPASIYRAALFLYLNRHGYNGLCRYNQNGRYNVPYGKYKAPYFPELEIRQFAEKANDTKALFLCCSFKNTLNVVSNDSVIYCDPPYLPDNDTADFTQYYTRPFTPDDHQQLVNSLLDAHRKYHVPIVVSNSDTPATREIYKSFRLSEINVMRSISADSNNRKTAKEVIGIMSPVIGDATYNTMVNAGVFQ